MNRTPYTHKIEEVTKQTTDSIQQTLDVQLPNTFKITEDITLIGTDFTIKGYGVVEERMVHVMPTYEYKDNNKQLIAKAHEKLISIGVEIEVQDPQGNKLGSIEEQVIESKLTPMQTVYSIKDAQGNVLAKSKKLSFVGTDIDMYDVAGNLMVTMKRPAINILSDTRKVNIKKEGIDKRILVFVPCYKTYADNHRE